MNEKLKNRKGITLIALVVTIVVLLILAGVSISLVLDNNGIIQKSKQAKKEYGQAKDNEQEDLNKASSWIDEVTNGTEIVEPENIDDWEYTEEDDGTLTLNCYKGNDTTVVIPNYIKGKPVKKIKKIGDGYNTFWADSICSGNTTFGYYHKQETISEIIISDGIQEIGNYSFVGSQALTKVVIPNSVIKIGNTVFAACNSLTNITIPNSVKSVGIQLFYGIPSITVNVPFKEGKMPTGWDEDWNSTSGSLTINYAK